MITEVANAGKASAFQKIAEGGKNVVNKVKDFVKSPEGKTVLAATALTVIGTGLAVAGAMAQNNMEFIREAVHHLGTWGLHIGEAASGLGGATALISGTVAGATLANIKKGSAER